MLGTDETTRKLRLATERLLARANVKPGEQLAITTGAASDPRIVDAIFGAAAELGATPIAISVPGAAQYDPRVEPPKMFTEALKSADLVIPIVRFSSYTNAYLQILQRTRVLGFALPPTVDQVIDWLLNIDYDRTDRLSAAVSELLREAKVFRITSPGGTDISMQFGDRHIADDPGRVEKRGDENFLPGACVCVAPIEDSWNGSIVFDALLFPPIGLLSSPISLTVVNGRIQLIGGRDASKLKSWLDDFQDPNMYRMSHIGIGLNPRFTKLSGVKSIDERVYGLVGTGIGTNDIPVFGGTIRARGHTDGYMKAASIFLDDVPLLKGGQFVHQSVKGL